MNDEVGRIVSGYLARNAERAYVHLGEDISRAIGQCDWTRVQTLQRAKLRLERLKATNGSFLV